MHRRLRRLARRLVALAPVVAALGGQALAAGSLRAPYLPHAGTTPAPLSSSPTEGIAALRRAASHAHRPDLEARVDALLRALPTAPGAPAPAPMSRIDNILPPGTPTRGAAAGMISTR